MTKAQKNGFTLIELLVVISVLGLMASIVLVAVQSTRQKARDAKRKSDLKQMATALEFFYNDNGRYPTNTQTPVSQFFSPWDRTPSSPGECWCLGGHSIPGFLG